MATLALYNVKSVLIVLLLLLVLLSSHTYCCWHQAFDWAKQLVAAWKSSSQSNKLVPRLRDFQPALVGYGLTGQAHKALEVMDIMVKECALDLTGEL